MLHKWVDVNIDDMKKFIAMIIAMGLVQHQDIQDYWSKNEMLAMNILFCNFFKKSTNHYLELKENLLFLVFRLGLKGFP
jgi:hypothetical protein